jgi:pimeloyl-ACP methyl ester carboxylesterase
MKSFRYLTFSVLGLGLGLGACAAPHDEAGVASADVVAATGASLTETACADFAPVKKNLGSLEPSAFAAATAGLRCATLEVPEHRAAPGRRIALPIVVVKASDAPRPPGPPLVMITGGPVTPSTNFLGALVPGTAFSALRQGRDVVLVGERGEEGADPHLACPELDGLVDRIFGDDGQVHPISGKDRLPKLAACHDRLTAQGIDVGAYDVLEMAGDVHDAVIALGYPRYSLYGVSFGTGLSQSIAKLYPSEVEAVVLDSPVTFWDAKDEAHALTGNIHLDAARSSTDAWRTLFASCIADATCNGKHPNLEATFRAMLKSFDDAPLAVSVPHAGGAATWNVHGDIVHGFLTNQFNATAIPLLPSIIEGLLARDPGVLSQIEPLLVATLDPGPDASSGLTHSVDCSGWSFVSSSDMPTAQVDELVQRYSFPFIRQELDECAQVWNVPRVRDAWPGFAEPLESSTLPVLILPGKYDANTHPFKAEQIHAKLPHSFVHTVPDRGHVTISDCPIAMMNAFLGDPAHGDPDARCLDAMTVAWR